MHDDDAYVRDSDERPPLLDLVFPVYNEEASIGPSVRRAHSYLDDLPCRWRITIADSASTDNTWSGALQLSQQLQNVRALRMDRKGRGLALRTAWNTSDAAILAYTDVDLSTDLRALVALVAPLVSGHSQVAIGSRLAHGARVVRGAKREFLSRAYNRSLHLVFHNGFRDAQCGFKAVRADVARRLIPEVRDDEWFFDTELLLLAERNGLRVAEIAVDWIDDLDSRVDIPTAVFDDIKGVVRMAGTFWRGGGRVDFEGIGRDPLWWDRADEPRPEERATRTTVSERSRTGQRTSQPRTVTSGALARREKEQQWT